MARPKQYDDALRAALIAGAAEAIAELGVEGLSLRKVATANRTSTNAVYAIFGGRAELIAAVMAAADDSFTAAQRAVPATADPLADLVELGRAYRAWALAQPALYTVMFGGRVGPPDAKDLTSPPSRQPLEAMIDRALAAGLLTGGTVEELAVSIWASVHGLVSLELAFTRSAPMEYRDSIYEQHLAAMTRGWAAH